MQDDGSRPPGAPALNVGSGHAQVVQDFVHSDLGRAVPTSRAMLRPKGAQGEDKPTRLSSHIRLKWCKILSINSGGMPRGQFCSRQRGCHCMHACGAAVNSGGMPRGEFCSRQRGCHCMHAFGAAVCFTPPALWRSLAPAWANPGRSSPQMKCGCHGPGTRAKGLAPGRWRCGCAGTDRR